MFSEVRRTSSSLLYCTNDEFMNDMCFLREGWSAHTCSSGVVYMPTHECPSLAHRAGGFDKQMTWAGEFVN